MAYTAWENFLIAAQGGQPERVPVALYVTTPVVSELAGISALDAYTYPDRWLDAYLALVERFPEVIFLPGFGVEYGPATEPSAFGAVIQWQHDRPPILRPIDLPPDAWGDLPRPDPYTDGLMALVLHRLWNLEKTGLLPEPYRVHFVAAHGPFESAARLLGVNTFLDAVAAEPDLTRPVLDILDILTDTTIRFLQAQLGCLRAPGGVLLVDDTVGMLSASQFARLALPFLGRILDTFDGLIRIYHNSTPCDHLAPHLARLPVEVFHCSHRLKIASLKVMLGGQIAVMGNVAALEHLAHGTPPQVDSAAREVVARAAHGGGLILSAGGPVIPGTPPENIDALVRATLPRT